MKYLKSFGIILLSLILLSIILGTLNYFNIFNQKALNIFEILSIITSTLLGGLYLGKNSKERGYLEGIKISLITIVMLFIFNYLAFDQSFSLSTLFFYIIIIISSILGSILGINKKAS